MSFCWFILFLFWICHVLSQQNNESDCECVPFYICTNGTINTNGVGVIDIRMRSGVCESYLDTCCKKENMELTTRAAQPIEKPVCGGRNPDGIGYRITGNTDNESEFGEFPWMVAVFRKEKFDEKHMYKCGGSLIHPQVVLTAAHCVQGSGSSFRIRAGEWDSQTLKEMFPHENRDVSSIVIHSQYKDNTLENDIALLFLKTPLTITNHINTVCLPPQDSVIIDDHCFVTGWGKDRFEKEGQYQVILKRIELPIMPRERCQNAFRTTRLGRLFQLFRSFICAGGEEGKDACTGDGGGPLVCPIQGDDERYQQVGIVAWGIGCGKKGIPGAYTDVAYYRNWIDQQMNKKNLKTF